MKRQRNRSRVFYASILTLTLVVGLVAPAAMAQSEGLASEEDVLDDDVEHDEDPCALAVTLEGELVYEHEYSRPDVRYKKQVEDRELRWSWKRWEHGVKEYQYAKQVKVPEVRGHKEWEYTRTDEHFEDQIKYHKVLRWLGRWTTNHNNYAKSGWIAKPADGTVPGLTTGGTFVLDESFKIGHLTYKYTVFKERSVKTGETVHTEWFDSDPGGDWTATGNWKWIVEPQDAYWRFLEPHEPFYNLIEWGPAKTTISAPGGPWTVGVSKKLGDGNRYRYLQLGDWRWAPGHERGWHHFDGEKSATAPAGYPVKVPGSAQWFNTGEWNWVKPHRITDWLHTGDQIDTGIPSVGLVDPDEVFTFLGKNYRYTEWKTRTATDWFLDDPGGDWSPTGEQRVYDAEPNHVRVTINDEVVEDVSFGEDYAELFLLDHGDTYLVEYKLHGDEDWTEYTSGVADCAQPDDLVVFSEWDESELECDTEIITLTRTKTTTSFAWDPETRSWVEDLESAVEETETDSRELTSEELAWQASEACVEVEGEVITQPETEEPEPEVDRVSVERKVETQVLAESLPRTGASILALLLTGLLALFTGTTALRRRNDTD